MSLLLTRCSVNDSPDCVFDSWARSKEHLTVQELHQYYSKLRYDGLSLSQVRAAVQTVCSLDVCSREEFVELLEELDRRFALVQDLRWEFNLLAQQYGGSITEDDAILLFKAVHDNYDWKSCWQRFIKCREKQSVTRITWEEIEVPLCALSSLKDEVAFEEHRRELEKIAKQEEEERELLQREKLEREQVRRRKFEEQLKGLMKIKEQTEVPLDASGVSSPSLMNPHPVDNADHDVARREKMSEGMAEEMKQHVLLEQQRSGKQRLLQEELVKQHELAKEIALAQEQRRVREEDRRAQQQLKDAERQEEEALIAAAEADRMAKQAKTQAEREAAEKAKKEAMVVVKKGKEKKLRHKLDTAIKSREISELEPAIAEIKKENVPDCSEQLAVAQKLLNQLKTKCNLDEALVARQLQRLEQAMEEVKVRGFEGELEQEMLQANQLLEKLRKLEAMKAEIMNLNQQKVAEIKSYKQPPLVVHQVMIASFLLLGNSEVQTRSWPATQVQIGKTGRDALKRRVSICDVSAITLKVARRVRQLLEKHDIDSVREASQGCATFYAWAMGMVEERMSRP